MAQKIKMEIKMRIKLVIILILMFSNNALAQENTKGAKDKVVAKKVNNLTIFSENNMTYPLVKIARLYSQNNSSTVSINFNDSSELIQSIDAGEPADVFISSHPDWIENLKQKGLVDVYNLTNLAKDRLVLITSKNNHKINTAKINQQSNIRAILREISNQHNKLIVDSKYTSLGKYTDTVLKKDGVLNQKVYRKNIEDKKSIADFINENDEYYGIILASTVKNHDNILVLKTINSIEIHYQALVIAGNNMSKARDLLKFIKSKQAKNIFAESGFIVE